MRSVFWKSAILVAVIAGIACDVLAQSAGAAQIQQNLTAKSEPPPAADAGSTKAGNSSPTPKLQPTVTEELDALKSRIEQLENEVKVAKTAALADNKDTAALKAAEKELLTGNGAAMVPSTAPVAAASLSASSAQAAPTVSAEAPATKEISAQTTTKGEPFPGDWTWLNSNGHAVDSPMSTKYFTPEFRADAN